MTKNKWFHIAALTLGLALIGTGIFLTLVREGEPKRLVGILLGVGAGLTGMSVGNFWAKFVDAGNPDLRKQAEIERNDERNTLIRLKAKATAADMMQVLILAAAFASILLDAPLWVTLAIVGTAVLQSILTAAFTVVYQRRN